MNTEALIDLRDRVGEKDWYLISSLILFADSRKVEFEKAHGTKAVEDLSKYTD